MITRCGSGIIEDLRGCEGKIIKCVNCGGVVYNKRDVRNSLFFPELKGKPHICSACIFEKLTGDKRGWGK